MRNGVSIQQDSNYRSRGNEKNRNSETNVVQRARGRVYYGVAVERRVQ